MKKENEKKKKTNKKTNPKTISKIKTKTIKTQKEKSHPIKKPNKTRNKQIKDAHSRKNTSIKFK